MNLTQEELRHVRALFLDEAAEHMAAIDESVAALEALPADAAALSSLLRKIHTLKGSAGTVDFDELSRAAHVIEDRGVAIRDAGRPPFAAELVALVAGVDALRSRVSEATRVVHGPATVKMPIPVAPGGPVERRVSDAFQIRVEVAQVDELMEAVGELVIDRTRIDRRVVDIEGSVREVARVRTALRRALVEMQIDEGRLAVIEGDLDGALARLRGATDGLSDDAEHLRQTAQGLEDGLQRVRMMDVGRLFLRLAGPVKEMARRSGKEVELHFHGAQTAIDKAVVERVADPLLHLLRNAVAHGIESAEERAAAGKPAIGSIELAARWRGAELIIEVGDDGAGIDVAGVRAALVRAGRLSDEEVARLTDAQVVAAIFDHSVSTRPAADALAGRGLGLEAVKEAIAQLGGAVTCASAPGRGARFTVRLPLTAAIMRALLFKVGGHVYAVPSANVVERQEIETIDVRVGDEGDQILLHGRALPLVRLGALLGEPPPPGPQAVRQGVVLDHEGLLFGITCDKVIGDRQIVVKGLGPLLASLPLYAGATLSGAGKVQLILDVAALAAHAGRGSRLGARPTGAAGAPRVLLVDDSRTLRETVALILAQAGYEVETAPDGWEAWELLQDRRFDLLLTDGEMPRLDGYELTCEVRKREALSGLPVVLMTSRDPEAMRQRAFDVGADRFLDKPLRRQTLLDAIAETLARRPR